MIELIDLIPYAESLLQLAPEELAFYVLRVARECVLEQNSDPQCYSLPQFLNRLRGMPVQPRLYDAQHLADVQIAVTEAWGWLLNQLYLVTAPGIQSLGGTPLVALGRRTKALTFDDGQWKALRAAAAFPKELLHKKIAERVWISILRNEFDSAIFFAFRTVEEAVREAGNFQLKDIGVPLMRSAFNVKSGPLTDMSQPEGERQSMIDLFVGAFGSYRNSHLHRTIPIHDASEAQEIVMLASHLLRIVDARRPPP